MLLWKALHRMRYETDGEFEFFVCDECGKRVRVAPDLAIVERGDDTAVHAGSVGGIEITGVEIKAAL